MPASERDVVSAGTADTASGIARNPGIDTLRGISIVLVLLHHLALRIPLDKTALAGFVPKRVLDALGYNGYEAVFVFFVVSGFLIASNVLQRWRSFGGIDIRAFYVRRVARIVPCLFLLLAVLCVMHVLRVPDYVIKGEGQSLGGALSSALGLYLNRYEGRTGWLPGGWDVLWSLSIEEAFYLGFPLACLLIRSRSAWIVLLSVLAMSLPLTRAALTGNEIWQEKAYLPGMSAIATGILTALLVSAGRTPPRTAWMLRCAGILGLLATLLCGRELWRSLGNGYMLVLTGSTAMLLAGLQASTATPLRGLAWLRSFGRLSYEIYLSHMFVVFALVALYRRAGEHAGSGYAWYVPLLALCWGLGWLVARFWSQPCDRAIRGRWLPRGQGAKAPLPLAR